MPLSWLAREQTSGLTSARIRRRAEEVAKEVRAAAAKAILLRADVADLKSVEEMVTKMAAELGSVDSSSRTRPTAIAN